MMTSRLLIRGLLPLVLTLSLSACGGGGGGGDGTPAPTPPPTGPPPITAGAVTFIPDVTVSAGSENLVVAILNVAETGNGKAAVDLLLSNAGSGLNLSTQIVGLAAEMAIDPAWMTFSNLTLAPGGAAQGAAFPQSNDPSKLVIGLTDVAAGKIATVIFDIVGSANVTDVALSNLAFIGPAATILPQQRAVGVGGRLSN